MLRPGVDAQAVVNAHPEGATFVLAAGVHWGFSVKPRSGQTFMAEPGAVLDGQGRVGSAFYAFAHPADTPPNQVSIVGAAKSQRLVVRNYSTAPQNQVGAIHCQVDTRPSLGLADSWRVQWVELAANWSTGLRTCNRMVVRENYIHHNGQLGMGGLGEGVVVVGNEIAFNKTRPEVDPEWEGGGAKWTRTYGLVVRDNYVHDNYGPGLWTDTDNLNTTYEANLVANNEREGIYHEISGAAVIRANTLVGNGRAHNVWLWGAGIVVAGSDHVEVVGNVLRDNVNGISGIQQARGSGRYGPHLVSHLWVHDNSIDRSGGSGVVQDNGDQGVWSRSNRFENNTYTNGSWFIWRDVARPHE